MKTVRQISDETMDSKTTLFEHETMDLAYGYQNHSFRGVQNHILRGQKCFIHAVFQSGLRTGGATPTGDREEGYFSEFLQETSLGSSGVIFVFREPLNSPLSKGGAWTAM